jgi:metallo-beta-lactamase family protein
MLADSAKIQHEEALHANVARSPDEPWVQPLYSREDVERTISQCVPLLFDRSIDINEFVKLRLCDAGHILGSATVVLTVSWQGRDSTLIFSGDVGRPGMPLVRDPSPLPEADIVLCESTYGGHTHEPVAILSEALRVIVKQTVARGGKVLIPAFSLGRSQLVVHFLQDMMTRGTCPAVPIFVDSPLAARVGEVYRRHADFLDAVTARQLREESNFLDGPLIHYLRTTEESKELNQRKEPCVIVASSGMVEGGRVLHHLRHHVDDPRCTVVLVSYQAPDSIGARLLERKPTVRFLGREWNKWIEVVALKGFSGHADQHELLAHLRPLAGRARKVRLVHGEIAASQALAGALRGAGFGDVDLAERGEPMPLLI